MEDVYYIELDLVLNHAENAFSSGHWTAETVRTGSVEKQQKKKYFAYEFRIQAFFVFADFL